MIKRILIVSIVSVLFAWFTFDILLKKPTNFEDANKELLELETELQKIVNFFNELPYDYVDVSDTTGYGLCGVIEKDKTTGVEKFKTILIKNNDISKTLSVLFNKKRWDHVVKDDGIVEFQIGSNIGNNSNGLIFSSTKNPEQIKEIQFIAKCIPLELKGWFYYETDVEIWKKLHGCSLSRPDICLS